MTAYYGPYSPEVYNAANGAPIYSGSYSRAGAYNAQGGYQNAGNGYTATDPVRLRVLGASNTASNTTPTTGSTPGYEEGRNVINANANDQSSVLDQEYEDAMSLYNSEEQSQQNQAGEANRTIDYESGQVRSALGEQQAVQEGGEYAKLATGEKEATSAFQSARDLFRQTQQQNIANLSALGISSSSVAEALAERLGVETARRIAGATGSLTEIRQNATNELARIKNYYQGKATQVTEWVANEKIKIQNSLMAGLQKINQGRQQAATAKASARASLLSDVRTQLFQLSQQENQFQQSLKAWAAQKASATEKLITDPASVLAYNRSIDNLNARPGVTQTYFGNYGVTPEGQTGFYRGAIGSRARSDEEDPLRNIFQ